MSRYYFDLISILIKKEFKARYKNTLLGYFWSILHPVAFAAVYYVLFKIIMNIRMENYALFMICGIFPWHWFQNSVSGCCMSFVNNRTLIKKVKFPRFMLVLANVLIEGIHFLLTIPAIAFFMYFYGKYPSLDWIVMVPVLFGLQLVLTYSFAMIMAIVNLFFRDLERLIMVLMTQWFYLTPVLYEIDMIPKNYQVFLYFNPMVGIITEWRRLFIHRAPDNLYLILSSITAAIVVFLFSSWFYVVSERRFAEVV